MRRWSLVFLAAAIIAGAVGFGGAGGTLEDIAQVLFFVFVVTFILSFSLGLMRRKPRR